MFDPTTSDLAGISTATLQQWLSDAQQAMHDLMTGAKGENYSYTQGDGSRSVTYTRASIPQLRAYISELKAQLGISRGRRPIRFRFR
jgi:gpW